MIIMGSITFYGIYAMSEEWNENGMYVMGEVLVQTQVPFENFANLSTWLFYNNWLVLLFQDRMEKNSRLEFV